MYILSFKNTVYGFKFVRLDSLATFPKVNSISECFPLSIDSRFKSSLNNGTGRMERHEGVSPCAEGFGNSTTCGKNFDKNELHSYSSSFVSLET